MPERLDGLTRDDIREMFGIYARTNSLEDLKTLGQRDKRFRRPVFHAMLRQEHISLRSRRDLDDELKEGILRKYHLFFQFLHHDVYGERIQEIIAARQPRPDTMRGPMPLGSALLTLARSGAELVLCLVGELHDAGLLKTVAASGEISVPVLVERTNPLATLHRIIAVSNPEAENGRATEGP
jgi:hypothetical protein